MSLFFLRQPFLIISFVYVTIALLLTGPAFRFLTMLTPFFALSVSALAARVKNKMIWLLAPFLFWEIFYSVNSQLLASPWGSELWAYAKTRYENNSWGYNELDKFLEKELRGKTSYQTFNFRYKFLEKIQSEGLAAAERQGKTPYPALIVYDQNFLNTPQIWILGRLQLYHGWPIMKVEEYAAFSNSSAFAVTYFIIPTEKVPLKETEQLTDAGWQLESELIKRGQLPTAIKNRREEEVFRVYKF